MQTRVEEVQRMLMQWMGGVLVVQAEMSSKSLKVTVGHQKFPSSRLLRPHQYLGKR